MEEKEKFKAFKKLLSFVWRNQFSDFYRLKYEKVGFNPLTDFNSLDDIKKIPLLGRKELVNTEPFDRLFIEEKNIDFMASTAGTSSNESLLTFYSFDPLSCPAPFKDVNFGRILLLTRPFMLQSVSHAFKGENKWILSGDIYNLPASLQLASRLKINTIQTYPILAIVLKDYLENYPALKKSLRYFRLVGEVVTSSKKEFLQKLYPDCKFFFIYGSSEMAGRAVQCPYLAEKNKQIFYHPDLTSFYLEIIDPKNKRNIESEKEGELVITNFHNLANPLIRYKTGDLACLKKNNCPCGCAGPLLQVLGRIKHDIAKVGGVVLRTEMLEKAILNLKDYLEENFEAHIYENFAGNKPKIKVILNLSLRRGIFETSELKQKIENELLESWRLSPRLNLRRAVEIGLFETPQINFIRFPRSVKPIRKLILH